VTAAINLCTDGANAEHLEKHEHVCGHQCGVMYESNTSAMMFITVAMGSKKTD